MTARPHAFTRAEYTAHEWLNTVARHLDTQDAEYTYRVLRTWLHTVRDQLTIESAAHLAAQLPELLRGVFYDGWSPNRVPVRIDVDQCISRYAREARMPQDEVHEAAAAVSAAMRELFSPGQVDTVFSQLPSHLRALLQPETYPPTPGAPEPRHAPKRAWGATIEDRMNSLEHQLQALTEAVHALVVGLEELPIQEPAAERTTEAARQAHQLLLSSVRSE